MIVLGHDKVAFKPLHKCLNLDDIANTPPNSIVLFQNNNDIYPLISHCNKNNISFCTKVDDIKDLIIFSNLNAFYLIVSNKDFAKKAQEIISYYLLDSKILFLSNNNEDIEKVALDGIDGILFEKLGII